MDRDIPSLLDILNCAKLVISWTSDLSFEEFEKNRMLQSAIMYEIEVIGEATSRISSEFKRQYPAIPWVEMKDMRNVLIHDYDEIIIEEVWKTCREDIPALIKLIEPLVPKP